MIEHDVNEPCRAKRHHVWIRLKIIELKLDSSFSQAQAQMEHKTWGSILGRTKFV